MMKRITETIHLDVIMNKNKNHIAIIKAIKKGFQKRIAFWIGIISELAVQRFSEDTSTVSFRNIKCIPYTVFCIGLLYHVTIEKSRVYGIFG